jgi:hypothetical protein
LSPKINAKLYYSSRKIQDWSNCGEIGHLVAWGRGSKGQDFLLREERRKEVHSKIYLLVS